MERVLIVGCGYVGSRLAELLGGRGGTVFGLRRDPSALPSGVVGVRADVSDPGSLNALPDRLDGLVYAISPGERSKEAYRLAYVDGLRNVLQAITAAGGRPERVVLVSSTGVYGHSDGRWVDEDTLPEPADFSGRILLEGERVVREAEGTGVVLRLGGIYGPGRTQTVRRVLDGEAGCPAPDTYGNRIHRDDAAAALLHLLDLEDPHAIYIGVDRDPAPLREVYRWIAAQGGAPDPCRGGAPETGGAAGRRETNKRCSSERLVRSGFEFRYPSYREGYAPFIR
jgi:nucleoside-diphosphate-sugar epimerase